jgi:hypothetical protein
MKTSNLAQHFIEPACLFHQYLEFKDKKIINNEIRNQDIRNLHLDESNFIAHCPTYKKSTP